MIGFLRKDLYMLYGAYRKNFLLTFLLYAAIVLITKTTSMLTILIWLMAFYGLSAITMDTSCGWDRYARTLPVSSGAIITARFLTNLILICIGVVYAVIMGAILCFFMNYSEVGRLMFIDLMFTIALVTAPALASMGLLLPAAYKWGVEKVRNTFLLVFMLVFLIPALLKKWLSDPFAESLLHWLEECSPAALSGAALGAGLLVFMFGGWLSSRIYAKKEF